MSRPARPDALRGSVDLLILKALSLGATHGWGLGLRIQEDLTQTRDDVPQAGRGGVDGGRSCRRLERLSGHRGVYFPASVRM